MDELDRVVRRARWWEYPGLACLVARRLAHSRDPDRPPAGAPRRAWLWLTTWATMVVYGAWTTEHRQAVATSWVLDGAGPGPALRSGALLVLLAAAELSLIAAGPSWTPVAVIAVLAFPMQRLWRRWRARAPLRAGRRAGAVYVANLASAHKGAGRVVLDHIATLAAGDGRHACLEAMAYPDLIAYYQSSGFREVRRVDAGEDHLVVYLERDPQATSHGPHRAGPGRASAEPQP